MRSTLTTAAVASVLLTGWTAPAGAAVPTYDVRVGGVATIVQDGGAWAGTTIEVPVRVRCPAGQTVFAPFAGLPGFFADGRFAEPYLPGNTAPTRIDCTGHPQRTVLIARTVARLQDPATQPFEVFEPGRVAVAVQLGLDQVLATDVRTVQVR